jgi:hypothetical protein
MFIQAAGPLLFHCPIPKFDLPYVPGLKPRTAVLEYSVLSFNAGLALMISISFFLSHYSRYCVLTSFSQWPLHSQHILFLRSSSGEFRGLGNILKLLEQNLYIIEIVGK